MFFNKNKREKSAKTRRKIDKLNQEIAEIWNGRDNDGNYDTGGSYTGNPDDFDVPVQDADDL